MGIWSPTNLISPLTMWFKADSSDLASLSDGDTVAQWTNQATAQNVVQGTEARKPTLQTNELNGQPVVRFDGTNDILSDGIVADLNVGTGDVWFASVAKSTNTGGASFVWEKGTELGLVATKAGSLNMRLGGTTSIPVQNSGNWTRTGFFMVTASRVSSTCNGFYNAVATDTTGTTNTGSINNSSVFDVGAAAVGGNSLNGDIAELLVGAGPLDERERLKIESYFVNKYALTVLPSDHAYKSQLAAGGLHGVHNQELVGDLSLDLAGSVVSDTLAGCI